MYLSRQLRSEAVHVQFYLTLLDTYIPTMPNARRRSQRSKTFLPFKKAQLFRGLIPSTN
jgi:hypothetical protein